MRWLLLPPRTFLAAAVSSALMFAAACPASAQLAPTEPTPTAQPGDAEHAVVPQDITIDVGRGQMLQLPEPATSVLAADPSVARVQPASPTRLFLIAVAAGHTTIIATNSAGQTISQFDVTVRSNAPAPVAGVAPAAEPGPTVANGQGAEEAINLSVHGAKDIRVRMLGKDAVLTGIVPTPAAAQEAVSITKSYLGGDKATVIDQLLVLTSIQVNVRVRFAEISRTVTRQLGFNWQALSGAKGGFQFGLATGVAASGPISPLAVLGVTAANGAVANQIGFGSTRWDVNSVIDALAADNLVTILAEPNLTALSGETASFLAGGEFPVPVSATSTNQISISFKQYGVSLSVVPTVLSGDRLNLKVRPEVSSLTTVGAISLPIAGGSLSIPALSVSRADTTVELGSGQSFAIAGLLKKTTTDALSGLPGISDVPVLGALFRSDAFQREETELVIIVTPYIVTPASSPGRLKSPTDGFKPATDLDRILYGRQVARGTGAQATPIDAGFILR